MFKTSLARGYLLVVFISVIISIQEFVFHDFVEGKQATSVMEKNIIVSYALLVRIYVALCVSFAFLIVKSELRDVLAPDLMTNFWNLARSSSWLLYIFFNMTALSYLDPIIANKIILTFAIPLTLAFWIFERKVPSVLKVVGVSLLSSPILLSLFFGAFEASWALLAAALGSLALASFFYFNGLFVDDLGQFFLNSGRVQRAVVSTFYLILTAAIISTAMFALAKMLGVAWVKFDLSYVWIGLITGCSTAFALLLLGYASNFVDPTVTGMCIYFTAPISLLGTFLFFGTMPSFISIASAIAIVVGGIFMVWSPKAKV